jgi:hypothetical protein
MPIPAPTQVDLLNPGFEDGVITGWTVTQTGGTGTPTASTTRPYSGTYSALWTGAAGTGHAGGVEAEWINDARATVKEGDTVNGQVQIGLQDTTSSQNRAEVRIYWYNASNVLLSHSSGLLIRGNNAAYQLSTVSATAPAGAQYAALGVWTTANASGGVVFDVASWSAVYDAGVTLLTPIDGAEYAVGANVPFKVAVEGNTPAAVSVTYKEGANTLGTSTAYPFDFNTTTIPAGTYSITAVALFDDNTTITTAANALTITATPTPPDLREYKASNAYATLVAKNFAKLSSNMPSVALVTAIEVVLGYDIQVLTRAKDTDAEAAGSTATTIFDIVNSTTVEATMLSDDGTDYTIIGSPLKASIPLVATDFDLTDDGISDGKRWAVFDTAAASTVTIGSDTDLFGVQPIAAADFNERSLGIRFYPTLGAKPSYADSGDACIRFFMNTMRVRVYFDAGSSEYYFASADKTKVIKGNLVHSYVETGDLRNGDAQGILQLNSDLEVMDGTQTWIGDDWTIHAAYPPTDDNQIGTVAAREEADGVGMSYNGLPSAAEIVAARNRYVFITANFYGDRELDSIYGAHGLPRAFAYNGDFFYKIYTQPDPVKDSPRHLAYHHGHLALGYPQGNVDISVVGQPYNFDGNFGASSWAVGDKITGLLELSGTILGVFGSKSIWGISGTTVDNFATQVISPNIGAIEYTVTDMGFPAYANAYGIYTLSQTQQYGDYMGTPLSQNVSPWLRPRLVRKYTSDKEVVVAWPVRTKNQYRLAFSDGYIMSMTLNAGQQSAPTFSFQKYTIYGPEDE